MTFEHFFSLVERATSRTREYAKEFVIDHLPEKSRYFLNITPHYPNLKATETTYSEKGMETREFIGPITADQFVKQTWIEGRVPVWIDLLPCRSDDRYTYFDAVACNRFSIDEDDLYYTEPGMGPSPFGQKSPAFPPGWKPGDQRFSLLDCFQMFQHLRNERG